MDTPGPNEAGAGHREREVGGTENIAILVVQLFQCFLLFIVPSPSPQFQKCLAFLILQKGALDMLAPALLALRGLEEEVQAILRDTDAVLYVPGEPAMR